MSRHCKVLFMRTSGNSPTDQCRRLQQGCKVCLPGDSPHPAGDRPPSPVGPQPPGIHFLLGVLRAAEFARGESPELGCVRNGHWGTNVS
jgi:hypothetical protein